MYVNYPRMKCTGGTFQGLLQKSVGLKPHTGAVTQFLS